MMKKFKKIVSLDIGEALLTPEYWDKIDSLAEIHVNLSKDSPDLMKHLADADCILDNPFVCPVPKEIIDSAPHLRYIGTLSTGYRKVDAEYAAKKGVVVCNIPGFSTEAVAEFAIAAILEYIRNIEHSKQLAREGDFSDVPKFPVYEIKGKKFGIIGLGRIGGRIAELAQAFGADVCYWSRNRKKEAESKGILYKDVDKILSECDFTSINLAFNKDTENFMSSERIAKIKSSAVFINLSPNELIDFDTLERRLKKGDLVYIADHTDEMDPDLFRRLMGYKTCILYPPLAFATKEAKVIKQNIFVSNIENFLSSNPTNKVN